MCDQNDIDLIYLNYCSTIANSFSDDPKTKVGAMIVGVNNDCVYGFNCFPKPVKQTKEKWERPTKYEYVVHAEINALMRCEFDTDGATLYCTHKPCHRCLGHILHAKIKRVVYKYDYNTSKHQDIWDDIAQYFDEIKQIS